ncbi:hypothetical protein E4634_18110 [Mangrovimicrobium sediminis]|uniref:Uncharacterized protein n=1 Tax=Mangrovimicrobium sediminis TaxID=2562682 RepID=A0A4Z0LWE2_9GAMM|nr:hypothetical protein [Haliea sp. SAOS-164]TGD71560.1 hypothetical protein E4634_18110 [Haliea sp. SAOS-164]
MDNRLYFVLGDLLANLLGGAFIGWLVWLMIPTGWNMWLAMFIAMAVGMLLATFVFIPFSIFLGAMEVMVPLMLTGMVAGMVTGMRGAMGMLDAGGAAFEGAVCGLACIVAVWILNNTIRGPQMN